MARSLVIAAALPSASAWYLPGVAPHDFTRGERVELKVNKLTSTRTQVQKSSFKHPFLWAVGA